MNRQLLLDQLEGKLKKQIVEAEEYLSDLIQSRNSDTKSSAGDKYETGRSMVQQEINRAEESLAQLRFQANELKKIRSNDQKETCDSGSIVVVGDDVFLLGLPMGKVALQDFTVFCISLASPLGRNLRGKQENDEIDLRGESRKISKLL